MKNYGKLVVKKKTLNNVKRRI